MERSNLIDLYTNTVATYMKRIYGNKLCKYSTDLAHMNIEKIFDKNLDYLLTDSFIDFLCRDSYNINMNLERIHADSKLRNSIIIYYFEDLFKFVNEEAEYDESIYDIAIYGTLDTDLKQGIKYALERHYNTPVSYNRICDVLYIMYVVFTYYVLNRRQDNIYELCDTIYDNLDRIIDGLTINNINARASDYGNFDNLCRMVEFIFGKLENRNNREIK